MAYEPYRAVRLVGEWTVQVVQLALPLERVRAMLPWGLAPGPQALAPPGTHPVRFYFTEGIRASLPGFPGMDMVYDEQTLAIPYVQRTGPLLPGARVGPYLYMPRLWLDNWLPSAGGVLFWGFEKRMALIDTREEILGGEPWTVQRVRDLRHGEELIAGRWRAVDAREPVRVDREPNFAVQREIIDQPTISQIPWGFGPTQALSNFSMAWDVATLRSIEAEIEIHSTYVPGLPLGRHGRTPGLAQDPLGSYALTTPWELSLLYSPDLVEWLALLGGGFAPFMRPA